MAGLTSSTIADSYDQLVISNNASGGNTDTLITLLDGDGGTTYCVSMNDASTAKSILSIDGSHADGTALYIDNSAGDGDVSVEWQLGGTTTWLMGIEDGDSDSLKICHDSTMGTDERLSFLTASTVFNEDSGDIDFRVEGNGDANLLFCDAGNDRVGIGESDPDATLHIVSDMSISDLQPNTAEGLVHLNGGVDTSANDITAITFASSTANVPSSIIGNIVSSSGSKLFFGTSNTYANGVTNTAMLIDYAGNVGIGTTAPGVRSGSVTGCSVLEIAGTPDAADDSATLILRSLDTSIGSNELIGSIRAVGDDVYSSEEGLGAEIRFATSGVWNATTYDYPTRIEFFTNDGATGSSSAFAERMVIASNGDVGIGNGSPERRLHVEEAVAGEVVALFENSHATGDGISIKLGATSVTTSEYFLFFLDSAGNIEGSVSGGGSDPDIVLNDPSDRRLKENIIDIPDAMSIISKIKPRTFKWKNRGSDTNPRYGFIADEWFDVFPDSVIGKRDTNGELIADAMTTNDDGEEVIDRQMISTKVVIPVLVKAIQELSAKVEALENA